MSKEDNDNYNEEEYHFAVEPDVADNTSHSDFNIADEESPKEKFNIKNILDIAKIQSFLQENVQIRNAIIAAIALILLIIVYFIVSSMIDKNKSAQPQIQQPKSFTQNNSQLKNVPINQVNTGFDKDSYDRENKLIHQNLQKLQQSQNVINSKISTLRDDNLKISSQYQELSDKLNKLAAQIEKLSSAVEDQSQSILSLSIRRDYRPRRAQIRQQVHPHYMKYFVKAVIPGRAWLIAENGSTLTVRKGSDIPGYGFVTMVDVSLGRVLTSSGKVIAFAQTDS